ncbi:MAG: NAD(P)-dependent oxidoreductase, partial [bacterium]
MKIGFIGLGVMGNPMAQNLARCDQHELQVYDVAPEKAGTVMELGAIMVESVSQAVIGADLVMTSLPGPRQIEQVAFNQGLISSLSAGSAWIDLSTNNLQVCQRIVETATSNEIDFLDAPVSGGDEGARSGTLTILVGGNKNVFEHYLPILQVIGENVCHLGPHGAGYSAKIAQVVLCYL